MIAAILDAAHRLDDGLRQRFGRPYHALLGLGLVIEIVRRVREIGDVPESSAGIVKIALAVLLFAVLLVHQLGELHEHAARRRDPAG